MEDYIKEAQEKLQKKAHEWCELYEYGQWDPEAPKEFIATLLTEARKKWLEEEIEKNRESKVALVEGDSDTVCALKTRWNTAKEASISRLEAELLELKLKSVTKEWADEYK